MCYLTFLFMSSFSKQKLPFEPPPSLERDFASSSSSSLPSATFENADSYTNDEVNADTSASDTESCFSSKREGN